MNKNLQIQKSKLDKKIFLDFLKKYFNKIPKNGDTLIDRAKREYEVLGITFLEGIWFLETRLIPVYKLEKDLNPQVCFWARTKLKNLGFKLGVQ